MLVGMEAGDHVMGADGRKPRACGRKTKGEGKGEKWREGRERERDAREERRQERGEGPPVVLRRLLLLPGGGAARAVSVPTTSGTFEIRLQHLCRLSLSRDAYLSLGSA